MGGGLRRLHPCREITSCPDTVSFHAVRSSRQLLLQRRSPRRPRRQSLARQACLTRRALWPTGSCSIPEAIQLMKWRCRFVPMRRKARRLPKLLLPLRGRPLSAMRAAWAASLSRSPPAMAQPSITTFASPAFGLTRHMPTASKAVLAGANGSNSRRQSTHFVPSASCTLRTFKTAFSPRHPVWSDRRSGRLGRSRLRSTPAIRPRSATTSIMMTNGGWDQAGGYNYATVPQIPATGNHEYIDTKQADGTETQRLGPYWSRQFALPANGAKPVEATTYFVDYQGVRFVLLDGTSALELGSLAAQSRWLDATLASSKAQWNIVVLHQPIFTCARPTDTEALKTAWKPILERRRVDLVLQGHDHCYSRISNAGGAAVGRAARAEGQPQGPVYVVSVVGSKMYGLNARWQTQPDKVAAD